MNKIAIIGAGMSGLVLAKHLAGKADIKIFEKSRGVSGRMSTRYSENYEFDHGAQYFTARSQMFSSFLEPLVEAGVVESWPAKIVDLNAAGEVAPRNSSGVMFCGTPSMNMVGKYMAREFPVSLNTEIQSVFRDEDTWFLKTKSDETVGPFDWVVSTAPAPQTASLMPDEFVTKNRINSVVMAGCFTLMIGLSTDLRPDWDGAFVHDSPIGWMAINSAKPDRAKALSLVIQSTNAWADENMEVDKGDVETLLIAEAERLIGESLGGAIYSSLHRWRFANVVEPAGRPYLIDAEHGLAACGDWCMKGRVEAAFESGCNLAQAMKQYI